MMKKILIVIHNMAIGGAQKSLLSFLQCLQEEKRHEEYDIHVMPLDPTGEFLAQVPKCFTVKMPDNALRWMGTAMCRDLLVRHFSLRGLVGELVWLLRKRLGLFPKGLNIPQRIWSSWKRLIPPCREQYDAAIAYMDGTPAYYVMDKVQAKKKVLWLHNDYEKVAYEAEFDKPYYDQCDTVITISKECGESIVRWHGEQKGKICIQENITSPMEVLEKSQSGCCPEYEGAQGLRLLTIGRLNKQKGIDMAIDAARRLKVSGVCFTWLVVGAGSERMALEEMIKAADVEDCFRLIGARNNPYPYMRECDILVQSSRYEGKSIVLDEAKILCKPIVVTDYSTVHDAVVHGETGWIVDMTGEAVAEGIQHLNAHSEIVQKLVDNLQQLPKGNKALVNDYIEKMF